MNRRDSAHRLFFGLRDGLHWAPIVVIWVIVLGGCGLIHDTSLPDFADAGDAAADTDVAGDLPDTTSDLPDTEQAHDSPDSGGDSADAGDAGAGASERGSST